MGEFLDNFKNEAGILLRNKKKLISFLLLGILILAVPFTVKLIQQSQIIKSRASATAEGEIRFSGPGVKCTAGDCITTDATVQVEIISPFDAIVPTAGPTISPFPSPTPAPTGGGT